MEKKMDKFDTASTLIEGRNSARNIAEIFQLIRWTPMSVYTMGGLIEEVKGEMEFLERTLSGENLLKLNNALCKQKEENRK